MHFKNCVCNIIYTIYFHNKPTKSKFTSNRRLTLFLLYLTKVLYFYLNKQYMKFSLHVENMLSNSLICISNVHFVQNGVLGI